MSCCRLIRRLAGLACLVALQGCATPNSTPPHPLSQDEVDHFLKSGRDPRYWGITVYQGTLGPRYEFANRQHQSRSAQSDMLAVLPGTTLPVVEAKTGGFNRFNLLLDTSARESWLPFHLIKAMGYRVFSPPSGEYPDHVIAAIPGYAGVGNKIILETLHIESPIFYVPPATGNLGPLARMEVVDWLSDGAIKTRDARRGKIHAVMGAAMLRTFSYIRMDFQSRTIRFSTHGTYRPASSEAVVATLPLKEWKGRPAVQGFFNGEAATFVLDTGGAFHLSIPSSIAAAETNMLEIDSWRVEGIPTAAHTDFGLPPDFPVRLGAAAFAPYVLTLDYKQKSVWIEDLQRVKAAASATDEDAPPREIQYRGITR